MPLIAGALHLTYVQNTGSAFGLFKGLHTLFIVLSLLVCGWIIREFLARPATAPLTWWGLALVLGGAVGNLIDRVRVGYVIDFIDVRVWPVFNVADSAISIGIALLFLDMLRKPANAAEPA